MLVPDGARFYHVIESPTGYYAAIRANGTVVVNRTLHASEDYQVEVAPNGTEVVVTRG